MRLQEQQLMEPRLKLDPQQPLELKRRKRSSAAACGTDVRDS
jgi:hypothetical protein